MTYWATHLEENLTQGDLIVDAWVGSSVSPRKGLKRGATAKGNVQLWQEPDFSPDGDGFGHFLARGRAAPCLVLSQSCEIDKKGGKAPVLIAPVIDLAVAVQDEALREQYRSGGRYAFFPLPALDGQLPESYVDLRAISYVPRAVLDGLVRRGSASQDGAMSLTAHLVGFFTRVDLNQIVPGASGRA